MVGLTLFGIERFVVAEFGTDFLVHRHFGVRTFWCTDSLVLDFSVRGYFGARAFRCTGILVHRQ